MSKLKLRLVNMPGPKKKTLKNFGAFKFLHELFDRVELYAEDPDFILFSYWGDRANYLKYDCPKIFYSAEAFPDRDPQHFENCDFSFGPHYREESHYRLPNYLDWYGLESYYALKNRKPASKKGLTKRDFCAYLYSNPASNSAPIRTEIFEKLSNYRKIDSGGKHLNNMPCVPNNAQATLSFLNEHKFWIAFENKKAPGYTTEKIYNGFRARSLPIYWGNPRIDEDFNAKAFVNFFDFRNLEEVINRVKELDQDDERYMEKLNAPAFPNKKIPEHFKRENLKKIMRIVFMEKDFSRSDFVGS